MKSKAKQNGFSLVDLMIVLVIISILAAIAIPSLLRAKIAANEASAVSAVRVISQAENVKRLSTGHFTSLAALRDEQLIDDRFASSSGSEYDAETPSYQYHVLLIAPDASDPSQEPNYILSAKPTSISFATATGTKRYGVDKVSVSNSTLIN